MRVGVVAEVKPGEQRVALTPGGAKALTTRGHETLVQRGAGEGSGFSDTEYTAAGARLVGGAAEVWKRSELLLKVKEPLASEYRHLRPGLVLFTYLHLAPNQDLTAALVRSNVTAIAYETVESTSTPRPLLAPMSFIAGRLAAQVAAHHLQRSAGGPGKLAGGAPGAAPAKVLILGGGVVGTQAAQIAAGLEADVSIADVSLERLAEIEDRFYRLGTGAVRTLHADPLVLRNTMPDMDVIIGAVLVSGARAPHLLTRETLGELKPGSLLVDVAIDQGGCFETSRPTTHDDPVYVVDGIRHYCVANMPSAVPVTATAALTAATLPYVTALAEAGVDVACASDPGLAAGVNVRGGEIVLPSLAATAHAA